MKFGLWFAVLAVFTSAPALAGDIPLGDAAFTTFIQQKLQLYSPAPVRVLAPFSVAIGPETGANLVFTFKTVHDDCVKDPAHCADKVHDFIQDTARRFPAANSGPAPSQFVPSDKPAFMAFLAAELAKLMPAAKVEADDMTLEVTRTGGDAIPFDQSNYYKLCAQVNFECKGGMLQSLQRIALWLVLPAPADLRASLRYMGSCSVLASVGNSMSCKIKPAREPMVPFFRRAFANLQEVCFKPVPDGGLMALTNADRHDQGNSIDAALNICEKSTHAMLPALNLPPVGDGSVGMISGPFAASHALFPEDWKAVAQQYGGHLIIAVPARDVLLYMTGDNEAQIAALGARAQAGTADSNSISSDVFRWDGDGWSLATPTSTMDVGPVQGIDLSTRVH